MPDRISPPYPRRTVLRALTLGCAGVGLGASGTLISASPAGAAPAARELRMGMSGPEVHELQIRVAGWAADEARQTFLPVNGFFDTATEAAVRRFQHAYGLPSHGKADPATLERLATLAAADGSTINFQWAQFASPEGNAEAREHVRRLMYKLEALRHKAGGRKVAVMNGFRTPEHQARLRGPAGSMHTNGSAADITVAGMTTYAVYRVAQTCGFSGLGPYTRSWLHCDSRAELTTGTNTAWSWD